MLSWRRQYEQQVLDGGAGSGLNSVARDACIGHSSTNVETRLTSWGSGVCHRALIGQTAMPWAGDEPQTPEQLLITLTRAFFLLHVVEVKARLAQVS